MTKHLADERDKMAKAKDHPIYGWTEFDVQCAFKNGFNFCHGLMEAEVERLKTAEWDCEVAINYNIKITKQLVELQASNEYLQKNYAGKQADCKILHERIGEKDAEIERLRSTSK